MKVYELLEAEEIKSNNVTRGYHGEWNRREAPEKFKAMHAKLKKLFNEKRLLAGAANVDTMIRDYLDSTNGRHIANAEKNEQDEDQFNRTVVKTFQSFKRSYDPNAHF